MSSFVPSTGDNGLIDSDVTRWQGESSVAQLLQQYGLTLHTVPNGQPIPGSYWGDDEAGLVDNMLFARHDTPLHSILHEACHYVCMTADRRLELDTDAGGDYDEENAVCYLSIVLADQIDGYSQRLMQKDMDRWGYTFRLGSAQAWFDQDADEVRARLQQWSLIDETGHPTHQLRV